MIGLLEPLRQGRVDPLPAPPAVPALPALSVTRTGGEGAHSRATIQPNGTVRFLGDPGATGDGRLDQPQLDALRLLVPRLVKSPLASPQDCGNNEPTYVVEAAGAAPVTVGECRYGEPRLATAHGIVNALDGVWPDS